MITKMYIFISSVVPNLISGKTAQKIFVLKIFVNSFFTSVECFNTEFVLMLFWCGKIITLCVLTISLLNVLPVKNFERLLL